MARLTYKTDFKFGLLVLLILAGTYFFAARAIRSDRLSAGEVEAKLRLHMSRNEVERIFRGRRGARVVAGNPNTIVFSLQDPNGGLSNNYHFNFDSSDRLVTANVDDEFQPGYFTNRGLPLK